NLLLEAHEAAARDGVIGTDDASLVERLGHPVHVVLGDPDNIKITRPEDVRRSEQALSPDRAPGGRETAARSGIGYDAHAFAEDRPLVLAGVRLRSRRGLLGHSDADVVSHAVCDALLGAIGAGDIGQHFPDSDPQYAGISSLHLLAQVSHLVREAGWDIENVDTVVIAEEPRIAPHIPDMRRALAAAMATQIERVNVKAKTTEGMGFTGRGEGIASQAIALLRPAGPSLSRADIKEQTCRSTSLPKE
ncbi:MAG: 2-C-methyl-D-erythritol 2,4-cyclodiphosphate synthase, partial [Armatimonadota bacterium]|nr:2-C-methyl-D-erythritol 2,4-cyclodiphosphate synthase [Armatimonadota bacterium]